LPIFLHCIPQRLLPCVVAGENLQFATAIIVEPIDPPLAGRSAILENFGWYIRLSFDARGIWSKLLIVAYELGATLPSLVRPDRRRGTN
jgi:hypothetical protein